MYAIYGSCTDATVKTIAAARGILRYPLEELLAAITPRTRLIAIAYAQ